MARIAVLGLRNERQTVVSILHDLNAVQLEPLSKDVASMVRSERDDGDYRKVSDQLLRMKSLKAILPPVQVTHCQRFGSIEQLLEKTKGIDIDSKVASLEREKESLLTQLKEAENHAKLVDEFSFFPEDFDILQLSSAHSYFGRIY